MGTSIIQVSVACSHVRLLGVDISSDLKLLLMCVYRSPSSDLVNDKLFELLNSVLKNRHMYKPLIIGDFNFPHINWDNWTVLKSDNSSDLFLQCLRDNYAFQYVDNVAPN